MPFAILTLSRPADALDPWHATDRRSHRRDPCRADRAGGYARRCLPPPCQPLRRRLHGRGALLADRSGDEHDRARTCGDASTGADGRPARRAPRRCPRPLQGRAALPRWRPRSSPPSSAAPSRVYELSLPSGALVRCEQSYEVDLHLGDSVHVSLTPGRPARRSPRPTDQPIWWACQRWRATIRSRWPPPQFSNSVIVSSSPGRRASLAGNPG